MDAFISAPTPRVPSVPLQSAGQAATPRPHLQPPSEDAPHASTANFKQRLSAYPVRVTHSTFGPSMYYVLGVGDYRRVQVYVPEQHADEFITELPLIMQAPPVWTAMPKTPEDTPDHAGPTGRDLGAWCRGYLYVRSRILPTKGVYLPSRLFSPAEHIQGLHPVSRQDFEAGMYAFLTALHPGATLTVHADGESSDPAA